MTSIAQTHHDNVESHLVMQQEWPVIAATLQHVVLVSTSLHWWMVYCLPQSTQIVSLTLNSGEQTTNSQHRWPMVKLQAILQRCSTHSSIIFANESVPTHTAEWLLYFSVNAYIVHGRCWTLSHCPAIHFYQVSELVIQRKNQAGGDRVHWRVCQSHRCVVWSHSTVRLIRHSTASTSVHLRVYHASHSCKFDLPGNCNLPV